MNASKFRFHYLLSLGMNALGMVLFIVAGMVFLLSSSGEFLKAITASTSLSDSDVTQMLYRIMNDFLSSSLYAVLGGVLYMMGIVWNIVICAMRSHAQGSYLLVIAVVVGWAISFALPFLGWFVSLVIQVWAWFQGSKNAIA